MTIPNFDIDIQSLVSNITKKMEDLQQKRSLLYERRRAINSEVGSVEAQMFQLASTLCIKDFKLPPVAMSAQAPAPEPQAQPNGEARIRESGNKRPRSVVAEHVSACIAALRGGAERSIEDIHRYAEVAIGKEKTGGSRHCTGATMANRRDIFTNGSQRGFYKLSPAYVAAQAPRR